MKKNVPDTIQQYKIKSNIISTRDNQHHLRKMLGLPCKQLTQTILYGYVMCKQSPGYGTFSSGFCFK